MSETGGERERRTYRIRGVVQGVGFRPFVYRSATAHELTGSVRNLGDAGVEIHAEGRPEDLAAFDHALRNDLPPLARIDSIDVEPVPPNGDTAFVIAASSEASGARGSIPPDTAICDHCVADILNDSRYTDYWATSCTNCGPRFTVIEALPYDRPRTSMRDFPMCDACATEYTAPLDRRYHAQTIACATCGPQLWFDEQTDRAIERTAEALASGKIVAIQGIGGTHVACDARSDEAVRTLRERLGRPGQAFALMSTMADLERFAEVSEPERQLLESPRRPIVVLQQRPDGGLPASIAPGLDTVGVMLPYTGLHILLFEHFHGPLVMTSANLPGRPMLIDTEAIRGLVGTVVDHTLLHDRRIVARCDDSVLRLTDGEPALLRRSRGYVPESFPVDLGEGTILALGPETGLTFALYADRALTPSQHIGSVNGLETYEFLRQAIAHLKALAGVEGVTAVACDLHPQFLTTGLAEEIHRERGARIVRVQHHAAHLVSVMAEHGRDAAVGIVLDGYGYGTDGAAWGGEIFVARERRVERTASLRPVALPGGDLAARFPLRHAAALLRLAGGSASEVAEGLAERGMEDEARSLLMAQLARNINTPPTTSAGRFLDAVSAWLGLCTERTYEGEPAMRLEAAAAEGRPFDVEVRVFDDGGRLVLDTAAAFRDLVAKRTTCCVADIAASAQQWLARGFARLAIDQANRTGLDAIAASGGVFCNQSIASTVRQAVEESGLTYLTNRFVPCGDGGVSFGQAVFAGQGWTVSDGVTHR